MDDWNSYCSLDYCYSSHSLLQADPLDHQLWWLNILFYFSTPKCRCLTMHHFLWCVIVAFFILLDLICISKYYGNCNMIMLRSIERQDTGKSKFKITDIVCNSFYSWWNVKIQEMLLRWKYLTSIKLVAWNLITNI